MTGGTGATARRRPLLLAPGPGPARLLAPVLAEGGVAPVGLARHRRYLPPPPPPSPRGAPKPALVELAAASGLSGRGGAAFPTGRKLRAVAHRGGSVGVATGTEGEPASEKDRLLLTLQPHLVLDGALWAAAAVGAGEVVVAVDRSSGDALAAVRRALAERAEAGEPAVRVRVVATPPRYVAGEESALVHFLNGGPALPTAVPPRPFERGVGGRPTLVNNVETLSHLATISAFGLDWWRRAGTASEPGTMLATVSASGASVVAEVSLGTPGSALLSLLSSLPSSDASPEPSERPGGGSGPAAVAAVLIGGCFGTFVDGAEFAAAPFSRAGLEPLGASPGAGVVVVLPDDRCGLREMAGILAWYSAESAGQCGPCAFGLPALAAAAGSLAAGRCSVSDYGRLARWASEIEGRGACRHPDGAVRLLRSGLRLFAADVEAHLRGQPCPASGSARP